MATEQQTQEIRTLIDKWNAGMGALDTSALKSLWDQSDPNAIYLAEENKTALVGWAGIANYYDELAALLSNADYRYSDLEVDVFGEAAYAFCYVIGLCRRRTGRTPIRVQHAGYLHSSQDRRAVEDSPLS